MPELGQVPTSRNLASLMVSLVSGKISTETRILDPCIGGNIFFETIDKLGKNPYFVGLELDKKLVTGSIIDFFKNDKRELFVGNFFDFPIERKFDLVIMNPPYIRQELLNSAQNSKENIQTSMGNDGFVPQKRSNLYVYFLLKALKHLKKNGHLVAITYDSWLYTDFGKDLKRRLFEKYNIEKIIHFREYAFDKINIGATIILISNKKQRPKVKYYVCDSPIEVKIYTAFDIRDRSFKAIKTSDFADFNNYYQPGIEFSNGIFTTMESISSQPIRRGTSAIVNKFFIFKKPMFSKHIMKFIKDVTKIRGLRVNGDVEYILAAPKKVRDKKILSYLERVKSTAIKNKGEYKVLAGKIAGKKDWHMITPDKKGNIVFNYYMRDKIYFYFNPKLIPTSDNFYNLNVTQNLLENFCILNSNFTRYALLRYGRPQGGGLFKIQLSTFRKVPIMDASKLSNPGRHQLKYIATKLLKSEKENSQELIAKIDSILIKEYNNRTQKEKVDHNMVHNYIENIRKGEVK